MTLDPNELAPGIRALVLELRAHGFQTCDSGDGSGKMDGALPYRHVFSTCPVDLMVAETERMARIYPDSRVELLWSPGEFGMIALYPDQDARGLEKSGAVQGRWMARPHVVFDHRKAWEDPTFSAIQPLVVEVGSLFRHLAIEAPRTATGKPDRPLAFDHRKYYDEDNRFNDCRAHRDGDCTWAECPQDRDNEPHKTGRHCPLDVSE